MIIDTFDRRTMAKMEAALERACLLLPTGSDKHNARRIVAGKIIECGSRLGVSYSSNGTAHIQGSMSALGGRATQ